MRILSTIKKYAIKPFALAKQLLLDFTYKSLDTAEEYQRSRSMRKCGENIYTIDERYKADR